MKVIVEVAINGFDRRFYFSYFWNPLLQFLVRVVIIVPRALAATVPSQICKIGSDMDFRGEKRLVNDGVRDVVLGKCSPGRRLHPGLVSKLDGVLVPVRKDRQEAFQMIRLELVPGWKLDE